MPRYLRNFGSVGCLLVALCASDSVALAGQKSWVEIRTSHFSVVTDDGVDRGREVALHFEKMRSAFARLMSKANVSHPSPLRILALANGRELEALLGSKHHNGPHSGIFMPAKDESFILVDLSAGDPWRVVFHEYAHELLNANTSSNTQAWFDEGFAEYFSTVRLTNGNAEIGLVPVEDLQFLRRTGKLLPLKDLFQIGRDSKVYNQAGEQQSIFYAESWLLVHYLFDRQLINNAQMFFSLASKADVETASARAFDKTLRQLEQELVVYARGERFRYFRIPSPDPEAKFEARQLGSSDVEAIKADVRWHSVRESEQAVADYSRALKNDPNNMWALRGIGQVYLEHDDFEEAATYLQRAAEFAPGDSLTHYYFARVAYERMRRQDSPGAELVEQLIHEAALCTAIDPSFSEAYRLLAIGYSWKGADGEALAAMGRAEVLGPREQTTNSDLQLLQSSAGHMQAGVDSSSKPMSPSR